MTEDQEFSRSVLLVDDDASFRGRLARALRSRGFDVREAGDFAEAIAASRDDPPEMAVVDLRMPGPDGLEVVRGLLEIEPAMRVVVLTGYGSIATALRSVRLGAVHYLTKPAYPDEIVAALESKAGEEPAVRPASEAEAPSLARVEWEHIQRVLTDCDGNISHAARRLGLHRRSLQRKLGKAPVRE
jgi:two-component system response regulator RegA